MALKLLCIFGVLILPQSLEKSMKSVPLDFNGLRVRFPDSTQKRFYVTLFQYCKLKDSKFVSQTLQNHGKIIFKMIHLGSFIVFLYLKPMLFTFSSCLALRARDLLYIIQGN